MSGDANQISAARSAYPAATSAPPLDAATPPVRHVVAASERLAGCLRCARTVKAGRLAVSDGRPSAAADSSPERAILRPAEPYSAADRETQATVRHAHVS